jgi:hypothetical protein
VSEGHIDVSFPDGTFTTADAIGHYADQIDNADRYAAGEKGVDNR